MNIVAWLGMAAGAIASVGIIYRQGVRPVFRWAQRLEKTMTFVEQQMLPNGGSSLRDSVNRIEARLTLVEEHITNPR